MRKYFIIVGFLIVSSTVLQAQIDKNSGGILIKAEDNKKASSSSLKISPNASLSKTNNGFTLPNAASKTTTSSKKPMVDMSPSKSKFIDQTYNWEPGWKTNKSLSGDKVLGRIRTESKYIILTARDYGAIDGDNVRVSLNSKVIQPNLYMRGEPTPMIIDLEKGENVIEFMALSMGEQAPNTAEFKVIDDKGVVIFSNVWALETGYKGTFTIFK